MTFPLRRISFSTGDIMQLRLVVVVGVLLVSSNPQVANAQRHSPATLVADSVVVAGNRMPFSVLLPAGYSASRKWPLILALHGAGSRGSDGTSHRGQSVVTAARDFPHRYPAILVLPQLPATSRWTGAPLELAYEALQRVMAAYPVDSSRVYVVGQSMGADGVFELASRYPERFAAALAVAVGRGDPVFSPPAMRLLPIWVFHGTADAIPVAWARARVESLRQAGNRTARFRAYEGRGHDIFDDVYRDSAVSTWLLQQRRRAPDGRP